MPEQMLVDDSPSDWKTAEPIASGDKLRRYVEHRGDEDWFSFEADGASTYRLQLHELPADYDLALYDASGNEVASSAKLGKRAEEIRERLSPGRYYVRVVGQEGAWDREHSYQLELIELGSR